MQMLQEDGLLEKDGLLEETVPPLPPTSSSLSFPSFSTAFHRLSHSPPHISLSPFIWFSLSFYLSPSPSGWWGIGKHIEILEAGLEDAISSLGGRRLIH